MTSGVCSQCPHIKMVIYLGIYVLFSVHYCPVQTVHVAQTACLATYKYQSFHYEKWKIQTLCKPQMDSVFMYPAKRSVVGQNVSLKDQHNWWTPVLQSPAATTSNYLTQLTNGIQRHTSESQTRPLARPERFGVAGPVRSPLSIFSSLSAA